MKKIARCSFSYSPLGMCMDVLVCFIEFMCQREFVWVLLSEILSWYILGESMSRPFDFCETSEQPFFSISGSLLYPPSHLFRMWLLSMLWCKLPITHFSISLPSSIFILFLHFTLFHLISFFSHPTRCLTLVQCPHFILAYSMCPFIYHHFSCGNP